MDQGFEEFAEARLNALLGFGFRLTGSRHQAEDLVQEALIRTGLRWRSVRRSDRPEVYVQTVMTRLHIDNWRRVRLEDLRADQPDQPARRHDHDGAMDLQAALRELPPRQRAVLVLRYWADYTEAQTADVMGCSVGTVKSQSNAAITRLRSVLDRTPTGADDQEGLQP